MTHMSLTRPLHRARNNELAAERVREGAERSHIR
jgi:hypothetical protein